MLNFGRGNKETIHRGDTEQTEISQRENREFPNYYFFSAKSLFALCLRGERTFLFIFIEFAIEGPTVDSENFGRAYMIVAGLL